MPEQEQWRPSLEQQIEGKFGKETIEEAAKTTTSIFETIKRELADIGMREGTSSEQKEAAESYLAMLREFANNLFARTTSVNAKSPETVRTAIEGANALLSPEPTNGEAAQQMVEELEKRFGKK